MPLAGADVQGDAREDRLAVVVEAQLRNANNCHA